MKYESFKEYRAAFFPWLQDRNDELVLSDIVVSWDYYEFCENNGLGSYDWCWEHLKAFYDANPKGFKKLYKQLKGKIVDFGYITELSCTAGVYAFVLKTPFGGISTGVDVPQEFFAKGNYTPKEQDKLTRIETKGGMLSMLLRRDGKDDLIFTVNEKSKKYKDVMAAARKRMKEWDQQQIQR